MLVISTGLFVSIGTALVLQCGSMETSDTQQHGFCSRTFPVIWSKFIHSMTESYLSKSTFVPRSVSKSSECGDMVKAMEPLYGCDVPAGRAARPPTFLPKVDTLIAIGDVHGDISKAKRAFRLAGLIDDAGSWVGGKAVAVQVGDILDRGNDEVQLYYWLENLKKQAHQAGGAVHVLNGNHETMNVASQFRYATKEGVKDFSQWARIHATAVALKSKCMKCSEKTVNAAKMYMDASKSDGAAARFKALQPGGEFSRRFLAPNPVILAIGSTVFVHGGLLPHHVEYGIEKINNETQDWILHGEIKDKPPFLSGRRAVVWARDYSHENEEYCDCDSLRDALAKVPGAKRMVVGHTIQGVGINSACNEHVYRVDVGLSRGCGDGVPEVLVIKNDSVVTKLSETKHEESSAEKRFHDLEEKAHKTLHVT